jgi:universal stress protein A
LVPLDGSAGSEAVLPTVGELARAEGAIVRLLRVVPRVEAVVRFGDPVEEIVEEAESAGVDLIALATHRRTGVRRLLKGSVAERVERATAIPVLLVRYGEPLAA